MKSTNCFGNLINFNGNFFKCSRNTNLKSFIEMNNGKNTPIDRK